jgi:hypothetical protein
MNTSNKQKTCFVVIGYGVKTDLSTGRLINLDKTYENLIKPVFDELNILCFRASDIKHSGIIDVPMYENLLKSDIVIADLSTLNANALYELGVRHALKPSTTIVIAENQLQYPFDLNHTIIFKYKHLGEDIGVSESKRFGSELKSIVEEVLREPKNDSPVYAYIKDLNPPSFNKQEIEEIKESVERDTSLADIIVKAESLKNNELFDEAVYYYNLALNIESNSPFIIQRLALVTYKSKKPTAVDSLLSASDMMESLNPLSTTDPETLGLMGAINKRLYDLTNDLSYLAKSLFFYERGFYIKQDYYNGINLAYLYNLRSSVEENINEAKADYLIANRIRKQVVALCNRLLDDSNERVDLHWILFTLAEAYYALDDILYESVIEKALESENGTFASSSFYEQMSKLKKVLTDNKNRFDL